MHQCLAIPEILAAVFQHFRDMEDREEGSAILARLAVTCKSFKEPALDALWYRLPSFHRLIGCLPPDAIDKQRGGRFPRYHRLTRRLGPNDFDRIQSYASRVKILLGLDQPELLDPILLPVLLSQNPNPGPLLSTLRSLNISIDLFNHQAFYPRLVVGPTLKAITLFTHAALGASMVDYPWDNVQKVLMTHPIALESFKIHASTSNIIPFSDSPPVLVELIHSFKHIKVLDVPTFCAGYSTFSHLASLPELQELSISGIGAELALLVDVPFPNLRKLQLRIQHLIFCETFFQFPRFQQLQSLKIVRNADVGPTWNIAQFFLHFRTGQALPALTSLDIRIPFKHYRPPRTSNLASPISLQTLEPLFTIVNLTTLRINVDTPFNLNLSDLVKIGTAWPHLRVLELQDRMIHSVPNVALADLIPFLSSCPNLEELALRVNALQEIPSFAQLGEIVPHCRLRKFNYCRSPIKEPRQVAAFLAYLLPNISELDAERVFNAQGDLVDFTEDPTELLYVKRWEEVQGIMKPLLADD
ncbi:hypothetical protein FPV67DRAFT_212879 [Lyophyllum atratum]|nr:hypothetical protein FPV67DRAFT_212879 [Lyophyllum atratum]